MNLYFVKIPKFVQRLFPKRTWMLPNDKNIVYLTFDDGPIPQVTPWVLDLLKEYHAKATFFCIGDNINKHPNIFKRLISEGHSVGNHTYHHLNGWETKTEEYIDNCEKFDEILNCHTKLAEATYQNDNSEIHSQKSTIKNLFRPPFGKLTSSQFNILQKKGYKIIMWDVLSADFDPNISIEKCLDNVLKNLQPGSIVVFHDSLKSEEKLRYVLPKVLEYIKYEGYYCKSIN